MPDVGTLSATVELNDSQLATTATRAAAEYSKVEKSINGVARTARQSVAPLNQFQTGINLLTRGTVSYSQSAGAFVTAAGKQINTTQLLNQIGIQTTGQIQAQIAAVEDLAGAYAQDAAASARLAQIKGQLNRQLEGNNRSFTHASQGAFAFGNIIQDSAQFSVNFTQGVRSIANNLPNLILGMSGASGGVKGFLASLKGPGGLIIALNLITTAIVLFGDKLGGAKEKVEGLGSAVQSLVDLSPIELDFKFQFASVEQLDRVISSFDARIEKIQNRFPGALRGINTALLRLTPDALLLDVQREELVAAGELERVQRLRDEFVSMRQAIEDSKIVAEELGDQGLEKVRQKQKESLTLLQEALRTQKDLRSEVQQLAGAGAARLALIEKQNRALQEQVDIARSLAFAASIGGAVIPERLQPKLGTEAGEFLKDADRGIRGRFNLPRAAGGRGGRGSGAGLDDIRLSPETIASLQVANAFVDDLGGSIGFAVANILTFQDGWRDLGDIVDNVGDVFKNVLANVIQDIVAATAKMLILKGLLAAFGGGTGFFPSVIRNLAGASGITARTGSALPNIAAAGSPTVVLQGNLSVDLDRLNFSLSENRARAAS